MRRAHAVPNTRNEYQAKPTDIGTSAATIMAA